MDKLVCGGLVREFAGGLIFGQKKGKVFVVLGSGYDELLEWGFGCWRGGVLVSSWEDFGEICGPVVSGILRGGGVGFC